MVTLQGVSKNSVAMIDPVTGHVVVSEVSALMFALGNDFSCQNARQANKDGASLAVRSLNRWVGSSLPASQIQQVFHGLFNGLRFMTLSSHCLTCSCRSLIIRPPFFKVVSTLARCF
jgi:hypothetical protein